MDTIRRDSVEVAMQARKDGQRVTLDNFRAVPATSSKVSVVNSNRAIAENLPGNMRSKELKKESNTIILDA